MTENDLSILSTISKTLSEDPNARQRDIARKTSLSLGMTNAVLRRFAEKGWIMMKKISTRNIRYVMTPEGMNELAKRSYHYMQRTFKEVRDCYDTVAKYIRKAKKDGYTSVVLYGKSDIAFIVEQVSSQEGIFFSVFFEPNERTVVSERTFGIVSEKTNDAVLQVLKEQGCVSVFDMAKIWNR